VQLGGVLAGLVRRKAARDPVRQNPVTPARRVFALIQPTHHYGDRVRESSIVVDVSAWPASEAEFEGRVPKLWVQDDEGTRWLFKQPSYAPSGLRQGEDWAEWICCRVATALGVPAAEVEAAVRCSEDGIISRNIAPAGWDLLPGSVALSEVVPEYAVDRVKGRPGHSLDNIQRVLVDHLGPPHHKTCGAMGAFAVFAGMLVLDALVANTDRHHRNWGVLRHSLQAERPRIAPAFDHGSALGYGLSDDRRRDLLAGDGVERWAQRGLAREFEHDASSKPVTLVDHAAAALRLISAQARDGWLRRLDAISDDSLRAIVYQAPRLSEVQATFIVRLLAANRRRLLDVS
jgi:hypothetical protein